MEISVFPKKSSTFIRTPANKMIISQLVLSRTHIFGKNMSRTQIFGKKIVLATILDAILDFSARHQLCQFMPVVSETTDYAKHFGI